MLKEIPPSKQNICTGNLNDPKPQYVREKVETQTFYGTWCRDAQKQANILER